MRTWISLHQAGLLGLLGILAAILLINWQLGPGPPSTRSPGRRPRGRSGRAAAASEPPQENRAARRRAAGKRAHR
ncbi:hypothetical protein ACW9KT_20485 [Hymenobacter sp. HD11105]